MNGGGGWIPVYRRLLDRTDWLSPSKRTPADYSRAWIEVLHQTQHQVHNHRGEELQPGEFLISIEDFAQKMGWSSSKTGRFFERLRSGRMIGIVRETPIGRVHRVIKWDQYCLSGDDAETSGRPSGRPSGRASENRMGGLLEEKEKKRRREERKPSLGEGKRKEKHSDDMAFPDHPPSLPIHTQERAAAKGIDLLLEWEAFVGHYAGEWDGHHNVAGKWTKWVARSIRDAETRKRPPTETW